MHLLRATLIVGLLLLTYLAKAQSGCTDPQATNYDPGATENDGSCSYPGASYTAQLIAQLPDELVETSGLAYWGGQLWTHNDGGNPKRIYRIDTLTGAILQSVKIDNAGNQDWEDMAESDTHLYVGDFGNNSGDRTNLTIYKIDKADLAAAGTTEVQAELITFNYADQTDFTPGNNDTDYDCEAFFYDEGNLHLFSKNWNDKQTRHYTLPTVAGNFTAQLVETYDVSGLITGGDISPDGVVALVGYTSVGGMFMWLLYDYQGTDYFSGNKRRISLGNALNMSQMEAVVYKEGSAGFISAESFDNLLPQKLFRMNTGEYTQGVVTSATLPTLQDRAVSVYPTPVEDTLYIEAPLAGGTQVPYAIVDLLGRTQLEGRLRFSSQRATIGVQSLLPGMYFVLLRGSDHTLVRRVVRR